MENRTQAGHRLALTAAVLLAACGDQPGEEGTAFFLTEERDLRDGFAHLCPAMTAASNDPKTMDSPLIGAAGALSLYHSGPAFYEFASGLIRIDAGEAAARLEAMLAELEMTTQCSDLLLEFQAMATTAELRAMAGTPEHVGRGFRVVDPEQELRPWTEGEYADIAAEGGVALTHPTRHGLTRPFVGSVTPVVATLDECEAHARAYVDARGLALGAATIETFPRTGAGSEPQRACMFFALPSEPHARVWGWVVPMTFGTFRIVCEGDDRGDQGSYCASVATALRPSTDVPGGAGWRPDFTFRVPEWRKQRRGPPTTETETDVPTATPDACRVALVKVDGIMRPAYPEFYKFRDDPANADAVARQMDGSVRECAWMRTPAWVDCAAQATTLDDLDRCDADDRIRRGFDDALCSRFAEHVAPLFKRELEKTKALCVGSWPMPLVECALTAPDQFGIAACQQVEWGP